MLWIISGLTCIPVQPATCPILNSSMAEARISWNVIQSFLVASSRPKPSATPTLTSQFVGMATTRPSTVPIGRYEMASLQNFHVWRFLYLSKILRLTFCFNERNEKGCWSLSSFKNKQNCTPQPCGTDPHNLCDHEVTSSKLAFAFEEVWPPGLGESPWCTL